MADLSDLEDQKDTHHHLVLYEAALLELTHGNIPCRTLRLVMNSYNVYVYPFCRGAIIRKVCFSPFSRRGLLAYVYSGVSNKE